MSTTRSTRSPRWLKGLLGGLAILVVSSASLLAYRRQPSRDVPLLRSAAITLVPGVHLLGGLQPSAAYVVETPEGLVLVDSGLDADASLLRQQMTGLGLDWRRIRAILLTHAHGDHCGGASTLREATGAKIYAGKGDAPVLRAGTPREAFFSTFAMPDHAPHATPVDVELAGGETLTFGGVRIKALGTPGHTPGSICYLLERDGLRVLFAGDVISMLHGDENPLAEVRKPLGTYSAYLSPRYRGDARTYLASLRALKALPVPDLVLPGHPSSDPMPQSPSMTLPEWQALLDRGVRDMETLVGRYGTDGADFLDGNPKRLLPDLYYLGDFGDIAVYALVAASKLYLVNAPGGPEGRGLSAFVESRLESLGVVPRTPAGVLLTSCDPKSTAGLKGLIDASHAKVVAGQAGVEVVKSMCPPGTAVLPANELSGLGWFQASPVALRGRGQAPTAYVVPWAGKSVLFTGLIPSGPGVGAQEALAADLAGSREDALEYLVSLTALADLEPDLWLPAVPSDDQNANLYDRQWKETVAENTLAAYHHLRRPR